MCRVNIDAGSKHGGKQNVRLSVAKSELCLSLCRLLFAVASPGVRGWGAKLRGSGLWRTEVPQRGPEAEPGGGLGAKPPEAESTT